MSNKRYLEINGKEIEVSEEVYKEYMRPIWKEKKRIQRAYQNLEEVRSEEGIKSSIEKNGEYVQVGSFESGFMDGKEYGLPLSLEVAEEEYNFEAISSHNVEDIITYRLLEEAFLDVINKFPNRDKEILKLLILYQMKEREVAEVIGVSQKTVNNIKNRYLPIIQRKMKPWKK